MADIKELENKMKALMTQARECVDFSMELMGEEPETKKVIYKHWENFLVHFFDYVKKKEKDAGEDILKGISLTRLLKFL